MLGYQCILEIPAVQPVLVAAAESLLEHAKVNQQVYDLPGVSSGCLGWRELAKWMRGWISQRLEILGSVAVQLAALLLLVAGWWGQAATRMMAAPVADGYAS